MKKSVFLFWGILFLSTFLFLGCAKESPKYKAPLFPTEEEYKIRIKTETFEGCARIFFDAEERFHLIHSENTSPLFGMEEIYDNGKIAYYFQDLYREENFFPEGTAQVFSAVDLILKQSGRAEEERSDRKDEVVIHHYREDQKSITLYLSKKDQKPIRILGEDALSGLEIEFLESEQN